MQQKEGWYPGKHLKRFSVKSSSKSNIGAGSQGDQSSVSLDDSSDRGASGSSSSFGSLSAHGRRGQAPIQASGQVVVKIMNAKFVSSSKPALEVN
jgi:hypothetical protein